jgi:hypothetical protein
MQHYYNCIRKIRCGENYTEPPLEFVGGEEVYKVKTIFNHRKKGGDTRISLNSMDILFPMHVHHGT